MKAIQIKGCRILLVQKTPTTYVSIDYVFVRFKLSCILNKQHTALFKIKDLFRCYFPYGNRA